MLGFDCCADFSLVVVSRSYSAVEVCGLLIVVASLVAEHRLDEWTSVVVTRGLSSRGSWALSTGSVAVDGFTGFSCSFSCGIFLDQVLNACLLPWQVDSLLLRHQGCLRLFLVRVSCENYLSLNAIFKLNGNLQIMELSPVLWYPWAQDITDHYFI